MSRSIFRICALSALLALVLILASLWPIPDLGFISDLHTGAILQIRPGSIAQAAGLREGDQVLALYDHTWHEVNTRLLILPLPWQYGTATPMMIARANAIHRVILYAGPPAFPYQIEKLLRSMTALICWGTGYLLGTSPRADDHRLRWAAWFWLFLGLSVGLYQLADLVSYITCVAMLWFQCTLLAPLCVAFHLWYPSRSIAAPMRRRLGRLLVVAALALHLGVGLAIASAGSTVSAFDRLLRIEPLVFIACFVVSAALLGLAYRAEQVQHVRRQIRIIGFACSIVACAWLLLLLVFVTGSDLRAILPAGTSTIAAALIPLAYLVTGVSADLMRLDQVARRAATGMLAALFAIAAPMLLSWSGLLVSTPTGLLIIGGALAWPSFQLSRQLLGGELRLSRTYAPLRRAAERLGSTLDRAALIALVREGLDRTFHTPPSAFYYLDEPQDEALRLAETSSIKTPAAVQLDLLARLVIDRTMLLSASEVQARLGDRQLDSAAAALVFHAEMLYLGVIRSADEHVLGLLVLGPRGDQDPYSDEDRRELSQLLTAAALAFANSFSYAAAVRAQEDVRHAHRRAEAIRQRTMAEVARTIHDEVLNGTLFRNHQTLRELTAQTSDPWTRDKLRQLREEERAAGTKLRYFCEQLQPTTMLDVLGLEASLRQCIAQTTAHWRGTVALQVAPDTKALPVATATQRHLVLITREALNNAMRHAPGATRIVVALRFPADPTGQLTLAIRDNGRLWRRVTAKRRHFGLGYMQESAYTIGGDVEWRALEDGGTEVLVTAPLKTPSDLADDAISAPARPVALVEASEPASYGSEE